MSNRERIQRLEEKLQRFQRYFVVSVAGWAVVVAAAFVPREESVRFDTIDVERINIVEADGRKALVLANAARLPGPIIRGEEYPTELSGGREAASGIIFFNHEETEAGGLVYHSEPTQNGASAGGSFTFDRMNQDQVVQLTYQEEEGEVFSGLQVFDRPADHIKPLLEAANAHLEGEIDQQELVRLVEPELEGTARRVRMGSANRTALLEMSDTRGMARIRLVVDSLNARLEFLDSTGAVVLRLPEPSDTAPAASDEEPAPEGSPEAAARVAAEAWLAIVDDGDYGESWERAAPLVRQAMTPDQWEDALRQVREPLGAVRDRTLRQAEHTGELPGLPVGEYVVLTYETAFVDGNRTERLILQLDDGGTWQPIDYMVRP